MAKNRLRPAVNITLKPSNLIWLKEFAQQREESPGRSLDALIENYRAAEARRDMAAERLLGK